MAKQNNGGGSAPKIPETSDEQDQIRRAAKSRRRHTLSGLANFGDTPPRPGSRKAPPQAVTFRTEQAKRALDHEWMLNLDPGSVAHKVATEIFQIFPTISVPKDSQLSRTRLAYNHVLLQLCGEEVKQRKQLAHGRAVATRALTWAYEQLNPPADPVVEPIKVTPLTIASWMYKDRQDREEQDREEKEGKIAKAVREHPDIIRLRANDILASKVVNLWIEHCRSIDPCADRLTQAAARTRDSDLVGYQQLGADKQKKVDETIKAVRRCVNTLSEQLLRQERMSA